VDEHLQQLWRKFSADPTIENYEQLGIAYSRAGSRPRVIDIPARVFVADDTRATGRRYVCNLHDGAAIPADYFGDTLRETNHRIFIRAQQFGTIGGRRGKIVEEDWDPLLLPSSISMPVASHIVEHRAWRCYVEIFKPEALQEFVNNHVGILYVIDPVGNVIGWHTRMAQPFYPSAVNIAEQIFINCDDETKSMFRNALPPDSRIHEESWHSLKLLFIDIITM